MGVPGKSVHNDSKTKEQFFDLLMRSDQRNFTMIAASQGQGENRNAQGVVSGHAYSLISIHEVYDENENTIQLLRLRNPWGTGEWTGDWSDQSDLWTDDIKE